MKCGRANNVYCTACWATVRAHRVSMSPKREWKCSRCGAVLCETEPPRPDERDASCKGWVQRGSSD